MEFRIVQRIIGLLLSLFSLTMVPPSVVAWLYDEQTLPIFFDAFCLTLLAGLAVWWPVRRYRAEMRLQTGFLVVVLFWLVLGVFGAFPFVLSQHLEIVDAVFESISGLTTTGATVMKGLDELPLSVLYYRQQLQWLGGMGIIVLAVAVLPMLGVGGMQLYRAETPGPIKDNKLTPRITETAKALWYIYLGLTVACAAAYWMAGMTVFDAIAHSFSTVAIGGFSTHDASMGFFSNRVIEGVAIVFMAMAGINFSLHYLAWRGLSLRPYLGDPEFRFYISILLVMSGGASLYLLFGGLYQDWGDALYDGVFMAVSIATTTGFTLQGYPDWPVFVPVTLLLASFIGGCAGSTGGGLKVIRVLLLIKQGGREILRHIHPNAVFSVAIGGRPMQQRIVESVWGFFSLYILSFCIMSLVLVASGLDLVTAFSAVAACINNLGPGLGQVAVDYASINDMAKWVLCFAMLLGRLEIITLLVLLTPAFWGR